MNFAAHTLAYLATPFTKYRAGHVQALADATTIAGKLYAAGILVYSPIAYCGALAQQNGFAMEDYRLWLSMEERMCVACDVLIVAHLDGWEESDGIAREVKRFNLAGKGIYDLDPKALSMTRRGLVAA